jgi:hypothetical protein
MPPRLTADSPSRIERAWNAQTTIGLATTWLLAEKGAGGTGAVMLLL